MSMSLSLHSLLLNRMFRYFELWVNCYYVKTVVVNYVEHTIRELRVIVLFFCFFFAFNNEIQINKYVEPKLEPKIGY